MVMCVGFSPDGSKFLVGSSDGLVWLVDSRSGNLIASFGIYGTHRPSPHRQAIFSRDGSKILTVTTHDKMQIWETETGKLLSTLEGQADHPLCMDFSLDNKHLLVGFNNGKAILWEMDSYKPIATFSGEDLMKTYYPSVDALAFSKDGNKVLIGFHTGPKTNNEARLWEVNTGKILGVFDGHRNGISNVAFSPDESKLLTGSYDGTVRLWSTNSAELLDTYESKDKLPDIMKAIFSPDGTKILAGTLDGKIRLWEIAESK